MKENVYVITCASGHTGSVVAERLLSAGCRVRAIGRSREKLQALAARGAHPVTCDLTDVSGLSRAFEGALAVYLMLPPHLTSADYRAHQDRASRAMTVALENAGTKYAVSLSSLGAHRSEGTGPIAGHHYQEQALNSIRGLNVLHLRAGYFMENTLAQIGILPSLGMAAGALRPELKMPMIAARDIGVAASDALLKLEFRRQTRCELLGERDISMAEVTTLMGRAIGQPQLAYTQLTDREARAALEQIGWSANVIALMLEMFAAWNSGEICAAEVRGAQNTTPTSYETFVADTFVPAYRGRALASGSG
jgi:uncharacterized protein YbjT (DUF2867 family)